MKHKILNYSTFQKGKDKSETSYQQIRPVATLETNLNSKTLHCHNNRFWDPKLTVKPQSAVWMVCRTTLSDSKQNHAINEGKTTGSRHGTH